MEYVVERDPVNARSHQRLSAAYFYSGRFDDAIAAQRTALKLSPGAAAAHSGISLDLMLKGEPEAALEEIQQEPIEEYRLVGLAMIYHALGRNADSEAILQRVLARPSSGSKRRSSTATRGCPICPRRGCSAASMTTRAGCLFWKASASRPRSSMPSSSR
jgi:tetratricopeptide (TPR) repeat protein